MTFETYYDTLKLRCDHGLLNIRTSTLPCVWKIPDALFENETLTKNESI